MAINLDIAMDIRTGRQAEEAGVGVQALFTSPRSLSATPGVLTADTRLVRLSSLGSVSGDLWEETDTGWLYRWTGIAWAYVGGEYAATEATRASLTISASDNGAWFYATDTRLRYQVVAGSWLQRDVAGLLTVRKNTGANVGSRPRINLVEGSGITLTVADDAGSGEVDVTVAAVGLADGDKGDITVTGSGATWTIDNDAVSYAKMQNVSATDKVLGRSTAGAGDVEEIACTAAGRALIDDASASAQRTTLGVGTGDSPAFAGSDINNATRPTVTTTTTGTTAKGRTGSLSPNNYHLAINLSFDGANWNLDDTTKAGWLVAMQAAGDVFAIYHATAGANPRTLLPWMELNGANQSVTPAEHVIVLTTDYTGSDVNTAQKVFNSPTNGTITLPASTTYEFEGVYHIHTTGTVSHTLGILFGGTATLTSIAYSLDYANAATEVAAAVNGQWVSVATVTNTFTAAAAASHTTVHVKGIVRINAGGTFIPQYQWSAAPGVAGVTLRNSYFRMWPLGSNTVASVGAWS